MGALWKRGLVCWWKGSVRQAAGGAFRAVEGFRSLLQRGLFCRVEGFCSPGGWRGLVCTEEGSVRSYSFHPWSRIDGERVRGAPRRAPDTPGSRPTKPPLRGSLASISSHQVGRDTASCLPRPQARITRPIPGPRPFGAAASGVQKRSRRFCPCGPDLARQFRFGDFDAGPSPNFDFLMFY